MTRNRKGLPLGSISVLSQLRMHAKKGDAIPSYQVGTQALRALLLDKLVQEYDRHDPEKGENKIWVRITPAGEEALANAEKESQEIHVEQGTERALRGAQWRAAMSDEISHLRDQLTAMTARCQRLARVCHAQENADKLSDGDPHAAVYASLFTAKSDLKPGDLEIPK